MVLKQSWKIIFSKINSILKEMRNPLKSKCLTRPLKNYILHTYFKLMMSFICCMRYVLFICKIRLIISLFWFESEFLYFGIKYSHFHSLSLRNLNYLLIFHLAYVCCAGFGLLTLYYVKCTFFLPIPTLYLLSLASSP